ncbi:MAG TPA: ABC transporter ATP-binding protein [Porticoccus sp.]|nr:ABC transporter ATP-binding protein [Porticoccus sp.]
MDYLLQVSQLRKHYRDVKAVDGISFGIRPGICFGLLGPNGAGKTTTIEMIEGITPATSGEILYKGKPRDKTFSQETGIQFQSTALQDFLTVREVLALFHQLYAQPVDPAELIERCQLGELVDREANKLSGGQKQRLLLALALINDPVIVFLDEPTTGLDPQSRRRFWELITSIKAQGKTIVLTTHYMDEAELLCDELVIMDHGILIDQGSPRELLDKHLPHKRVCIDQPLKDFDQQALNGIIDQHNGQLEITTTSVEQTLQALMTQQVDLSSLRVRNPTLEDLFIMLTGHQLRE